MRPDDRRSFYWGSEHVVGYLKNQMIIKPIQREHISTRKSRDSGFFRIKLPGRETLIEISSSVGGLYVYCQPHDIKAVYRIFKEGQKYLNSRVEVKELIKPILPQSIFDSLQEIIFDFYTAISELETTRGFGNRGIIFTGPPGVGKTETMRWLSDLAVREFGRRSYKLGLVDLMELIRNNQPLNTGDSLIFMDDIDANLLRDRKITHNPMTGQFLSVLDGIDKREGRIIVASTNESISDVDPALRRPGRFEHIIHFDYPTMDLIEEYCRVREIELDPNLFEGWSFARIDLFLAKFKVQQHLYQTPLNVFYEKFIYEMGKVDETVEAYHQEVIDDE